MTGKMTLVLARKEANTYRSHGLFEEARDIYKKLLSSSPDLPPQVKADLKEQIQQIELEIGCDGLEECQAVSDEQIAVIKEGWRDQPVFDEIFTCASTFYQLRRFGDALEELKKLSRNKTDLKRATGAIAACLIQLHGPESIAIAADRLAKELFNTQNAILSFQTALAEKVSNLGSREQSLSMFRYLKGYKDLPPEIQSRIFNIARKLANSYSVPKKRMTDDKGAQTTLIGTNISSLLSKNVRIKNFFYWKLLSKSKSTRWFTANPRKLKDVIQYGSISPIQRPH